MPTEEITYRQEALRKATHFFALLIPIGYLIFSREVAIIILAAANLSIIFFEIVRLRDLAPWRYLSRIFGAMIRPKEQRDNFTGAFYILLSGLLSIVFFDRYNASAALTFIIVGDVASAMVGRRYGKHRPNGHKSLEGSAAFLGVALIIVLLVPEIPYSIGIIGAIVAAVAEHLSVRRNDNLTVPLASGLVMHLLIKAMPNWP